MVLSVAFGLMGAFFTAGMYVAGALGCLSLIIMFFFSDKPLWNQMSAIAWRGSTDFILVAVPLFILMGELVNRSGMGERMYAVIPRWIWFLPGGLIHTNKCLAPYSRPVLAPAWPPRPPSAAPRCPHSGSGTTRSGW